MQKPITVLAPPVWVGNESPAPPALDMVGVDLAEETMAVEDDAADGVEDEDEDEDEEEDMHSEEQEEDMYSEEQDEIEVEAEVELVDAIVTHSVGGGVSGEPDASLHVVLHLNNAHWDAMVVPHPYAHLDHNSVLGLQSEEQWDTTELLAELNYGEGWSRNED